jgi:hypothetical protein
LGTVGTVQRRRFEVVGGRLRQAATGESDDPIAAPGQTAAVGRDHQCERSLGLEGEQKIEDPVTGSRVEVPGRFIGQDQ